MKQDTLYVTYEQFGAVGDGVTDDMPAIVAAHAHANENGLPVKARDGAVYRIGGKALTAEIRTDTDFGDAAFLIDDTDLEDRNKNIFAVTSGAEEFSPVIKTLRKGQKKIDFPHEGTVYVRVFNQNHKIYRRFGVNVNNGVDQSDCFIVDPEGNILTDIDWDYEEITRTVAHSVDDAPITVKGGRFTTIANQWKVNEYAYHARGILVCRAHVRIENIRHYITGEGETGAPYAGFVTISGTYDVTIKNCRFTPHLTYVALLPTGRSSMGSYEISLGQSIGVSLIGVRQTIDIMDARYWGLMGSNFCKDMLLDDCVMSRFDAHMGVTNATIRGCELGHMCLLLIGHGTCLIENTAAFGYSLVSMREDYGSFFDGTLTVRNCVWKPRNAHPFVLGAQNREEHDFGYECRMPHTLEIDGLTIEDENLGEEYTDLYILPTYDPTFRPDKPFPIVPTKKLILANITLKSGRSYEIMQDPAMYPTLEVIRR